MRGLEGVEVMTINGNGPMNSLSRRVTFGSIRTLLVCTLAAVSAHADEPKRILLDGRLDDWANVPVAFTDPAGDHGSAAADVTRVHIANDENYIYLRFDIGGLANLQTIAAPLRIYFDIDRDPNTGWPIGNIGSDFVFMFPERRGAEQSAADFDLNAIPHPSADHYSAPTYAATEFELRFHRGTLLPSRGGPLFDGPAFDIIIEARSTTGTPQEYAPDGPIAHRYTLATGTPAPIATIDIDKCRPDLVRLLTWNVKNDGLADRPEPFGRMLAALQPDVICFQELYDTDATTLSTLLDQMLPLGEAQSWHVYHASDDAVCSRYPLSMTRGDTFPDTDRGQAMALVDLPDAAFDHDLYVISVHMKCCGSLGTSEDDRRQTHCDANANWFRELRTPGGVATIPTGTPIVIAGDYNMVGGPQPLWTLLTGDIQNEALFGADSPPDWDGTAMIDVIPRHNAANATYTWRNVSSSFPPGRLDFVHYTDSVTAAARSFVFNTTGMSLADLAKYGIFPGDIETASDHLPVVFDLAIHPPSMPFDADADHDIDLYDQSLFTTCINGQAPPPPDCTAHFDANATATITLTDWGALQSAFGANLCNP